MALSTGRSKLYDSMKTLRAHWENVQAVWDDPVRAEFEENFWKALEEQVQATQRAIDRLDQALMAVHKDCTPERET